MSEAITFAMRTAVPQENPAHVQVSEQGGKWAFLFLWFFTIAVYARPEDIFPPLGQLHLTFIFGCCAGVAYRIRPEKLRAQFEGGTPAAPEKYLDLSYYQKALAGL